MPIVHVPVTFEFDVPAGTSTDMIAETVEAACEYGTIRDVFNAALDAAPWDDGTGEYVGHTITLPRSDGERPVLRWGYADGVPYGAPAAWGGRFRTAPTVNLDLSCTAHLGPVENKRRLARRVRVVGDDVMRQVRRLYEDDGGVTPGVEVELFNDPEIRAVGLAPYEGRFDVAIYWKPDTDTPTTTKEGCTP